MKKLIFTLLLSFSFLGLCNADLAGFTIDDYEAKFNLTKKGVLEVVEDINVNFTAHRHGLYRTIPYIYSNYLQTPIKKVKVPLNKFSKSTQGNNLVIKIGDPKKTIIGDKFYSIRYNVKGSIREFSGYQELYRNMLGTDRNTPVNNFKFSLTLPTNLDLKDDDIRVYIGQYGSTDTIKAIKSGNIITIDEPLKLGPHEGVTLAVKLPTNYVPTKKYFSLYGWIRYYFKSILIVPWVIIFCVFIFCLFRARKKFDKERVRQNGIRKSLIQPHGKKIRDVIHYSLPEGYTAAEISAILNWESDYNCLSALLFSWIEDKYVILEEATSKTWLGRNKKDYRFKVTTSTPRFKFDESRKEGSFLHLQNPEETFWNLCFVECDINDLNTFTKKESDLLKQICDEIFYTIHSRFIPEWDTYRKISYNIFLMYKAPTKKIKRTEITASHSGFTILLAMTICRFFVLFFLIKSPEQFVNKLWLYTFILLYLFGSLVLYTVFLIVEWFILKRKHKGDEMKFITEEGIDAIEQTFGFKKYLLTVDDKKLQTLLEQDPTYFEKVLPYAIALGVGNHWIKKCTKHLKNIEDTSNLTSLPDTDWFDAVSSKMDVDKSISSRVHTIDHPHNDGGGGDWGGGDWGGGSSGSDGGGSSGGGGGGGGGGSW